MISQSELLEAANYDPETGLFTWRKPLSNKYAPGDPMGFLNSRGYVNLWIRGHRGLAHRFAWIYMHGELPEGQIDHINGDRRDNRISNLRVVSNRENSRNQRLCKNNQLGITGVYFRPNDDRWYASITVDKRHHLGSFKTLLDAAAARKSAELKYGFHPNHGGRAAPIARIIAMSEEKDAEILRLKAERDAAQARVAELEKQEPVGYRARFLKEPEKWMSNWGMPVPANPNPAAEYQLLYAAPVAPSWAAPEGMRLVPLNPTEEQWGGLARAIVFWMRSYPSNKHTLATLVGFITSLGHAVPEWMGDENELRATDHVISKGTIAVLIYKAMLAAAPAQGE